MCTAISFQRKDFYFGRTLDLECTYGEEVTIMPRHFPLRFRHNKTLHDHYAVIGMAHVAEDYPLYYDAANERGLAMAGLNFPGNAFYGECRDSAVNIASFEMIPWILSQCGSVADAKECISAMALTDDAFSMELPPTPLHWLLADCREAVTVEAVAGGIRVYENPVGVLTNNPPFPMQMMNLRNYMSLTPNEPENRFSDQVELSAYSRGMGAIGLPGDMSSQSRFVRAAFTKLNAVCEDSEQACVSCFFDVLGTVKQVKGCCRLGEGEYEQTVYTSCCNAGKGIYYYTAGRNHRIHAVNMYREKLEDSFLIRYPLICSEDIREQNELVKAHLTEQP